VLLVLDRDALMGVLEEHGHVARSTLRLLAHRLLDIRRARGIESRPSRPPPTLRLDLVSRMLTLRDALGLGIDGMATIARLARVARARQFERGAVVCEGDQLADVVIPLDGELVLQLPRGRERIARPGEVLGLVEAVAGVPVAERATAGTEATALVLSHHELAEDIEDEDALCFELIRSFAAQVWTALTGSGPMPDVARPQVAGGS